VPVTKQYNAVLVVGGGDALKPGRLKGSTAFEQKKRQYRKTVKKKLKSIHV